MPPNPARTRWPRLLPMLLAIAVLAALLAVLLPWWWLRGSLAAVDGRQPLPGLSAPVELGRDAIGVVDIQAGDGLDAARALGFVHAQERYFEMDLLRRSAAGELAALFGERALPHDRAQRRHRMRWRAQRELTTLPAAHRAQLKAYAEGVQAGLAALRSRPWPYLVLRQPPAPWQPDDSLLVGYAMYFDLQDARNHRELALDQLRPHLPPALFALLTHAGSQWDAPLQGEAIGDATLPDAATLDLRRLPGDPRPLPPPQEADFPGSNSFAVAGSLTADGRAILANDMHLGLRAPNLWFRARLRYPDPQGPDGRVDVVGFTLPGLPAVIVGSNTRVAWGFTNSYGDWLDWMRLPECSGTSTAEERIDVAGSQAQTLAVRESPWGPVMHMLPDGDCLALRWSAHLPGALNLQLVELARAGDLDQALGVARSMAVPAQNLLLADANGRIAWRLAGPLPQRGGQCRMREADDPDNCGPWPLATGQLPALADPDDGRLWTANARTLDGEGLARMGDGGYALGTRARQIRDSLQRQTQFDEAALLAVALDDRAVLLTRWWEQLQAHAQGGPALTELARAAAHWDGHAGRESVSYRLVREWRRAVQQRMLAGLLGPAPPPRDHALQLRDLPQFEGIAWPLLEQQPPHLLAPHYRDWNALLEEAARAVIDEDATPLAQRDWGSANVAAICHPLAAALPTVAKRWLCMPREPLPGDGLVPRVQSPAFGASQRMVVAPGHEDAAIGHMPGGQSGHPLSPFWGAGHQDWVHGRATPLRPGPLQHQLILQPARTGEP